MRRILTVLLLLFAFTGPLAAEFSKFDKALDKKVNDSKKDKDKANEKVRVIIRTTGDPDSTGVTEDIRRNGRVFKKFSIFPGLAAELPVAALEHVASNSAVARISLDAKTSGFGLLDPLSVSTTDVNRLVTGGPQTWSQYGVNGTGIGVAILDSGVTNTADVVTKLDVDFTGARNTADFYGHGTHVAGIVGGTGALSNSKYTGDAPGVNLVNLKVLDENGSGYTSNVIQAIEWAVQNQNAIGRDGKPVNIRVLNLSLGHTPYESATTDPLTIACRKAVLSGFVVAVAAGNYGKDSSGKSLYGGIASPGTEPSVITVGAISTYDTLGRGDDVVATYSSRGPSIDGLMKPDLAAPGSRIVAPMAPGNNLAKNYPQIVVNSNYMRMSGTSMSTPFVAAAAAMILQKNPALTPNAVKAILMYSAERVGKNALETGAGELNILGAVNLAANIDTTAGDSSYWLKNNGTGLTYGDDISGYKAVWGGTIVWGDARYTGNALYRNHKSWALTIVWGDTIVWSDVKLVNGSTIVWESDLAALNSVILGQTIVWDDTVGAFSAADIDAAY